LILPSTLHFFTIWAWALQYSQEVNKFKYPTAKRKNNKKINNDVNDNKKKKNLKKQKSATFAKNNKKKKKTPFDIFWRRFNNFTN